MSLIKNYGNGIELYDYTEKSILLVTPTEWGKTNAEQLRNFAKFGTNFKIEGNSRPGWIMAKRQQEQNLKKIEELLSDMKPTNKPITKAAKEDDSEEEAPRPRLIPKVEVPSITGVLANFKRSITSDTVKIQEYDGSVIVYGNRKLVDEKVKEEYGSYSIVFLGKWDEYKLLQLEKDD